MMFMIAPILVMGALGIENIPAATEDDTKVNTAGEDSAIEQEVGEEEDCQGNRIWEWWWNVLLHRI